jgi:chemotaxis-related protein WspB
MLALLFLLDGERYALPCERVETVVPLVRLRPIPHAPAAVAGLLNVRGALVPVVDLAQLVLQRPCVERLNTRIVLARLRRAPGREHLLGLLTERVIDTLPCEPGAALPTGVRARSAPFLGGLVQTGEGLAQFVLLDELLPETVRAMLFDAPLSAGEEP